MEDLITQYIFHSQQKGKRATTIKRDTYLVKKLLQHCPHLSESEIIKFFLTLKEKGYRASYINIHIDVLRNIHSFHPLPFVPTYYKIESFNKATMSDEEIESFLNLPCEVITQTGRYGRFQRTCDPEGHKVFTMFWKICAFTGMRMGEVALMTVDRVDFGRGVFVLEAEDTKTGKARVLPIAPNILEDVKNYVSKCTTSHLFPARNGGSSQRGCIGSIQWGYNFHKRLNRLGIKRKNLTPYSLRHSFCTRLFEEDIAFPKIMKLMGHTEPKTTLAYSHLTTKDIQKAVSQLPLVRRSTDPENILNSIVETIEGFNLRKDERFYFKLNRENGSVNIEIRAKTS